MIIPNDLKRQYEQYAPEYETKALEVLRSGWYIMGKELETFENNWAKFIGTKYCVGLASGLDALWLSFRILGIHEGDEVIVSANSYIACVMGITINGATPVFVEPDEYDNIDATKIEEKITPRTKAILAVHLFGQSCDMDIIMALAKKYNLKVVEDCAQSHGNSYRGKKVGTFGDISCFSYYPTKGCGAFGDGGSICTNDEHIAHMFRVYRNYGSNVHYHFQVIGANSRLDELQAGLLNVKLTHMDEINKERVKIAQYYTDNIKNPLIRLPKIRPHADSTWHQYVIHTSRRDEFQQYLKEHEIGSIIHYPIPPHLSEAYQFLGYKKGDFPITEKAADEVLSLPMYNGMREDELKYIVETINHFE